MNKEKVEFKQEEEMTDAFGNVIKVKAAKRLKMSNKEKKVSKEQGEEDREEDALPTQPSRRLPLTS